MASTQEVPTEQAQDGNIVLALAPRSGIKAYRMEIDEFIQDNAMTNLYLLAMDAMYKNSLTNKDGSANWWSYYSLSGQSRQTLQS